MDITKFEKAMMVVTGQARSDHSKNGCNNKVLKY